MGTLHPIKAQDTPTGSRTPEQEAAKQTEKYQKELKLTEQQAKLIYEINLKYARERQQSNNRTEAVSRIRKKSEEIKRVLSEKQNDDLQNKRLETQSVEIDGRRNFTRTRGAVRQPESTSRSNFRTEPNTNNNRPVRQNRVSPSTRQSTSQERVNSTSRPVRENYRPDRENYRSDRERQTSSNHSSSSSTTRERNTSVKEQRSYNNSTVRSSRSSEQRQSSSSSSRSERSSQPTRQSSGSRR